MSSDTGPQGVYLVDIIEKARELDDLLDAACETRRLESIAAASRERELEARVRELEADSFEKAHDCAAMERERDEAEARAARMEAALFHHGITVKPDGRFEYEDNSVLMGRERCEWSKVVNDAKRYRWLFSAEANGPEDYFNGVMSRVNGVYWGYYDGQPENWGAAIDAAMAGEE